ncbi:MAG: AAA family ATPase [Lentisphaerae bacterium]|nr:AAA family ATPase [Lentisphaerota bacterium]
MLTRFRVDNFRSLLNTEFIPAGINLLIGPNNAGKTNLSSALRFLALTSEHTLDVAMLMTVGERWNLTNFNVPSNHDIELETDCTLTHEEQPLRFSYRLKLRARKGDVGDSQSLAVVEEVLKVSGGRFKETPLLQNQDGQTKMLHEEGYAQNRPKSPMCVQAKVGTEATMLSQLYELENNPRAILFRRYLRSWAYYNFSPDVLRLPDVARDAACLLSNGANLSRALFALHNEKPRIEKRLIEIARVLEPRLDLFSFSAPDPEHVHLFVEDKAEHRQSARGISDGTLRFIAMAYVILMAEQSVNGTGSAPLIIIEEPENGLYVGHMKSLIERVDTNGKTGQFIFTSHSPYFIDLFDNNLAGIHVIKPGPSSSVLVKPDIEKLKHLLDEMPLGEMHFREMLA